MVKKLKNLMNGIKHKKKADKVPVMGIIVERRKRIRTIKEIRIMITIIVFLILLIIGFLGLVFVCKDMPNPKKLESGNYPESSQVFDRNGKLIYEIYADKRRQVAKLEDIPEKIQKATLAIEDINFYKHYGFDFKGIARGFYNTVFKKRLQGGSTITQQLVKNALLTQERTWTRKIKEAILTVASEVLYSKNQLLEMYFNQTPYGGTLWGIKAASKGIFNKELNDLTLAQAALLAGLPASPSKYSPFVRPDLAKKRQEQVLNRMIEVGFISKEEYDQAMAEELNYYVKKDSILAPHFVFYVRELLTEKYGMKKVTEGGLKITTSLDLDMQDFVQTSVASEVAKLKKYNVTNGAALVTEPKTGQILAMVGSKDYFSDDIDGKYNVTTALRQPGSSIKPLNYAVALETGKLTAGSILFDGPTCFSVENQKPYCPQNYGNKFFGIQTVRSSLANSLNIAAVKTISLNGVENFIASASAFGIRSFKDPSQYGLSITLGGGEVEMVDMATAFGVFANMGLRQDVTPILKVIDKNGEVLEEFKYVPGERVLSGETSFLIQQILSDDDARSMVFGRGSMLTIKKHPEVAVKTGTTNDLRDNWTIGFSPDYLVVSWVGNNNNSKMSGLVSGISGAAPIWNKVMTEILKDKEVRKPSRPADIVGARVCNLTGGAVPAEGCFGGENHFEYFKKEYLPKKVEVTRSSVLIDKDTGRIVKPTDNKPNTEMQEHSVFKDAYGEIVCLDCPVIDPSPTPGDSPH
jgi:penicillin-binding protein 1C